MQKILPSGQHCVELGAPRDDGLRFASVVVGNHEVGIDFLHPLGANLDEMRAFYRADQIRLSKSQCVSTSVMAS